MFALVAVVTSGCVKRLPPAPTPTAVVPAMDPAPPPPGGHGRIVVDVVEASVPVQRIQMQGVPQEDAGHTVYRFTETPAVLCAATPCIADVPAGNVLLGFPVIGNSEDIETELVHVGLEPSVYRRSLSIYEDKSGGLRVWGIVLASVGGAAAMTGTALLPIGLAKDHGGLTTAGGISLGAGAALLAFGIWAIRHDAPTFRPGSSNHFPLPVTPP